MNYAIFQINYVTFSGNSIFTFVVISIINHLLESIQMENEEKISIEKLINNR